MSNKLTALVVRCELGNQTYKQVLMRLADRADDDGTNVWPSKGTVARETELGLSTVKRAFKHLLKNGILIEIGKRPCDSGFTKVYRLNLEKIESLIPSVEHKIELIMSLDPVQTGPRTGSVAELERSPQRTPNHPKLIHKPPTHESELSELMKVQKILSAYPTNRVRNEEVCIDRILAAIADGIAAEHLLAAVQSYATKTQGYTAAKVSYSDNWFRDCRWNEHLDVIMDEHTNKMDWSDDQLKNPIKWIQDRDSKCRLIQPSQIQSMLARQLVSETEILAAGLEI